MTNSSEPLVVAQDLVKVYGSGTAAVRAVNGVSLELRPGELVLAMGPSGSGKTTLLSMIGGLLRPTSGTIRVGGQEITSLDERRLAYVRAHQIGFVFQAFNLLSSLTVEENVLFPARLAGAVGRAQRERVGQLLSRLGLAERHKALPRTLSGGEKQRVAIARALVNDAPLILADEPTGNLDSERGQEVVMTLHDLARDEGRGVLIVTHDPRVEDVADRILWLEDGALRDRRPEPRQWARDPVCHMRVDAARAAHSVRLPSGERLVFCSQRCLDRFTASPAQYPAGTVNTASPGA
jgi:putative ABC transport system ATP-binding protein